MDELGAAKVSREKKGAIRRDGPFLAPTPGLLLTDLYQLNMMQAYLESDGKKPCGCGA